MECPHCGLTQHVEGAAFCGGCGQPLSQGPVSSALCSRCGALLESDAAGTCPNCGAILGRPAPRANAAVLTTGPLAALLALLGAVLCTAASLLATDGLATDGGFLHRMLLPGGALSSVPWATLLVFFWCLCLLALRFLAWRQQQAYLRLAVPDLTEKTAAVERSVVLNRLYLAARQWRVSQNLTDVYNVLRHQAEIDAGELASGYSLPKLFIWAMPVLGFIGTVLGISQAVGQFSGFLAGEIEDIDLVKQQLVQVTQGLSYAFSTTFLGLVCALVAMLPASMVQKAEEDFLTNLDRLALEHVVTELQGGA